MDDQELSRLLGQWKAPMTPPHLRPHAPHRVWLDWLVRGTIPVRVPVAVAIVLLGGWIAGARLASPSPGPRTTESRSSGEVARYPLTGSLQGFDAVLVDLNYAPGVSAAEHRHPGFVLGYVMDGQMRFAVNNEPDVVVPAGQTFFEPPGALHTSFGSASQDAPVRTLVFLVVPSGSRVTSPP